MTTQLVPFEFESHPIRVLDMDGEPWFVAKDVLLALGYSDEYKPNRAVAHVPDEWKGAHQMSTLGGGQDMLCLSEPGLYFFINRSDKPKALPFQKWLAGEVLPTIRRTGGYRLDAAPPPPPETITLTKDEFLAMQAEIIELLRFKAHTLEPPAKRPTPTRMTAEEYDRIYRLHEQGLSQSEIARQMDRSTAVVSYAIRFKTKEKVD